MAAALARFAPHALNVISSLATDLGHIFGFGKVRRNKIHHVLHAKLMGGKVHIGHLMHALPKAKKFVEGEVAHLVKPIADLFGVGEQDHSKIHHYLHSRGHVKMGGAWKDYIPTLDQVVSGVKTGAEVYKVLAPLMKKKGGYNSAPNTPDPYSPEAIARSNERHLAQVQQRSDYYNSLLRSGMSQVDAWNKAYPGGTGYFGGNAIWDANFCDSMNGKPNDPGWCKSNRFNRTGVWSGGAVHRMENPHSHKMVKPRGPKKMGGAWKDYIPSWDQVVSGVKTGMEVYKEVAPLLASSNTSKGSVGYKSPLSSKKGGKRPPTKHGLAVKRVMHEHGMKLADASRYVKEHGLAHM